MLTVCCCCWHCSVCWWICLSNVLQSVAHCWHNLFSVPNSVQKEVNLSVWLDDELTNHPQLQPLAKFLPGISAQDKAPMTVHMFGYIKHGYNASPANRVIFALYLVHLIQQGSSVSLLNSAVYGSRWVEKKISCQELSDHPIVQQVAEAGRRILAKPPNHNNALEVSEVTRVIRWLEQGHWGIFKLLRCLHWNSFASFIGTIWANWL